MIEAIETLERDFPGTIESIKEIMRDAFDHWDEYEEQSTTNSRNLLNTCIKFRAIVEHDDPYWASSDLISQVHSLLAEQIDNEK